MIASPLGPQIILIKDNEGLKPQIVVDSCIVTIDSIDVSVHGSFFSWLYDFLIFLFKGSLKSAAEESIQQELISALNVQLDKVKHIEFSILSDFQSLKCSLW